MIKYFITKQFLMFLFVGGIAAVLNWLSRVFLSTLIPFYWSIVVAYFIGMCAAFTLNHFFVFPDATKPRLAQARDFIFTNLLSLPLVFFSAIKINIYLKSLGILNHCEEWSHAIALTLPTLASFLIYKFFAFKEQYGGL
jgi:putative flippase GtrA